MIEYIPFYIREMVKHKPGDVLTADEYNNELNLNIVQGDGNTAVIEQLVNASNLYEESLDDINDTLEQHTNKLDTIETGAEVNQDIRIASLYSEGVNIGYITIDGVQTKFYAPVAGGIVQSDWEQIDPSSVDFIKNKPKIKKGSGVDSIVEGQAEEASGSASHAEGFSSKANGAWSHAEGQGTKVLGIGSHAEGGATIVNGDNSHAEGVGTIANGESTHVEGHRTIASGNNSHVQGEYNIEDPSAYTKTTDTSIDSGKTYYTLESSGRFSEVNNPTTSGLPNYYEYTPRHAQQAFIIGNGNVSSRSNALTVDWDGKEWLADTLEVSRDPSSNMEVATKQYVDDKIEDDLGEVLGSFLVVANASKQVTLASNEVKSVTIELTADYGYDPSDYIPLSVNKVYTTSNDYNWDKVMLGTFAFWTMPADSGYPNGRIRATFTVKNLASSQLTINLAFSFLMLKKSKN